MGLFSWFGAGVKEPAAEAYTPPPITGNVEALVLKGKLYKFGDEGYENARAKGTWLKDQAVFGYPSAILTAACAEDVAAGLKFAAAEKLAVCVAGGRHTRHAVQSGALCIDMTSLMNTVTVDAAAQTATCQGGSLVGTLDAECASHGLAVTAGRVPTTGVCGQFTHTGGIGTLQRVYGSGVDSMISAKVVTANGDVLTASATENSDLFWAVRGGGGTFGVIAEVTFKLHKLPNEGKLHSGVRVHLPLGFLGKPARYELLSGFVERAKTAPDEFMSEMMMFGGGRTSPTIEVVVWVGEPADGVEHFKKQGVLFGKPVVSKLKPHDYHKEIQRWSLGPGEKEAGPGSYVVRAVTVDIVTDDMCKMLAAKTTTSFPKGVLCFFHLVQTGGKTSSFPTSSTALAIRDTKFWIVLIGQWKPEQSGQAAGRKYAEEWVSDTWQQVATLEAKTTGKVNISMADEVELKDLTKLRASLDSKLPLTFNAWGENAARRKELKAKFNTHNVLSDEVSDAVEAANAAVTAGGSTNGTSI